jgi:hypothetical protein
MVFVSLPDLEVRVAEQTYRTVSELDEATGHAEIAFTWGDFAADLVVDAEAVVTTYPGLARRLQPAAS